MNFNSNINIAPKSFWVLFFTVISFSPTPDSRLPTLGYYVF
ncbi:hypothetical protein M595_2800 [Lyngbya aestuarii BL J]|uniref:Uncharacterized protein n=1 Tax=Lyngbya aestuarii BL J TaxID=1348334 RepID=U7QLE4_9CYAN|nr:hypothetical protein M595_2800 [Lyngbya aestuarii BL J]